MKSNTACISYRFLLLLLLFRFTINVVHRTSYVPKSIHIDTPDASKPHKFHFIFKSLTWIRIRIATRISISISVCVWVYVLSYQRDTHKKDMRYVRARTFARSLKILNKIPWRKAWPEYKIKCVRIAVVQSGIFVTLNVNSRRCACMRLWLWALCIHEFVRVRVCLVCNEKKNISNSY